MFQACAKHRPVGVAVEETDQPVTAGQWQGGRIKTVICRGQRYRYPKIAGFLGINVRRGPQTDLYSASFIQRCRLPGRAAYPGGLITGDPRSGLFECRAEYRRPGDGGELIAVARRRVGRIRRQNRALLPLMPGLGHQPLIVEA